MAQVHLYSGSSGSPNLLCGYFSSSGMYSWNKHTQQQAEFSLNTPSSNGSCMYECIPTGSNALGNFLGQFSLAAITNYDKLCGLNQYAFIISQFHRSEVRHNQLDTLLRLIMLKSRCQLSLYFICSLGVRMHL